VHLTTRTQNAEGTVLINGKATVIADLELSRIEGTVVNGKGEVKQIDAQGILLIKLCNDDCTEITVTAEDEYSATVESEDFESAYLYISEDGSPGLAVFGDENAKRNVKNVARIDWT